MPSVGGWGGEAGASGPGHDHSSTAISTLSLMPCSHPSLHLTTELAGAEAGGRGAPALGCSQPSWRFSSRKQLCPPRFLSTTPPPLPHPFTEPCGFGPHLGNHPASAPASWQGYRNRPLLRPQATYLPSTPWQWKPLSLQVESGSFLPKDLPLSHIRSHPLHLVPLTPSRKTTPQPILLVILLSGAAAMSSQGSQPPPLLLLRATGERSPVQTGRQLFGL